jgi:hypothetical protein
MQNQKIILETNFTDPYENDPQLKFLLVDELHHGIHFSFISKWKDNTGIEGGVETYFDFEKALKKFIQRVDKERKQGINHKNLKIIAPNQFEILDTIKENNIGIESNSKQFINGLIGLKERVDRLEQQFKEKP